MTLPVLRRLLVLGLAASLASCSSLDFKLPTWSRDAAKAPATGRAADPYASREPGAGQWPQALSDLAPDPNIRFGALANGMRYAIMRNATPTGQVSLRMHFDAGSIDETDDQQGMAHLLEHMAFKGSTSVPEDQQIQTLERLGLAFGADTNASTSWDETIYQFDLPRNDEDSLATGIKLMRETASELTLAQSALDKEKNVVLSEERVRDTPGYRVSKARMEFLLAGQRAPTRFPIGKVEVLSSAKAETLRALYQRYYRPERATLVVTGDMDPAAMEARIRNAFSNWTATGPAGPEPVGGPIAQRGQQARLVVAAGVASGAQLAWVQPPETGVNTKARVQRDLTEALGFAVLNRRLQVLARSAAPPFISAGAGRSDYFHEAEITSLSASFEPGAWKPALAAIEAEQRRLVQFGVRQDELAREVSDWRASLQAAVAGAATRRTPDLADLIVGSIDIDDVVTSPAQDLALFDEVVKSVTPAQVNAAMKRVFSGQGPLLFVSSPTAIEGGEAALNAALDQNRRTPVTALTAPSASAWPYQSFGAPGAVTSQTSVQDLGAEQVTFANGVKLTVKPTKFTNDEVQVMVRLGAGLQSLPKSAPPMGWAEDALIAGGLKQISLEDMERVLTGKVWNANFTIDADAFVLSGASTRADFETEMQILAAYASEPGWRPEPFQRLKTYTLSIQDQMSATDGGVLSRDLPSLMHPGDRRFAYPSKEEIAAGTLDQLRAQIEPGLAAGPIEVTIVGDITVEQAIDLTGATFGALPPRTPANPPADQKTTGFPAGGGPVVVRTHTGRADQSILYTAWKTGDFFSDINRARAMSVLGQVIELRLIDELRSRQGATYSPSAGSTASQVWPDWGNLSISMEVTPDRLDGVMASIDKIAADLAAAPPTDDEMLRAKGPIAEQLEKSRQTNGYWVSSLSGGIADPRRLDAVRSVQAGLQRVTAAEVQQAARTYLTPGNAWRMQVKPAGP